MVGDFKAVNLDSDIDNAVIKSDTSRVPIILLVSSSKVKFWYS